MALSRLLRIKPYLHYRSFSSIPPPITSHNQQKIQTALSQILPKKNSNPAEQILYLCLSNTVSQLPYHESSSPIHTFVRELNTEPSLLSSFIEQLKTQPKFQKESFYTYFINLYRKAGMNDLAVGTFDEMRTKGIKPSGESVSALLRGLDTDIVPTVDSILEGFSEASLPLSLESYEQILKAYITAGYFTHRYKVLDILQRMQSDGHVFKDSSYELILDGLHNEVEQCESKDVLKVIELLRKQKVPLSIDIYNLAIWTMCKREQSDKAYKLYLEICGLANVDTYRHLISGFGEEDRRDMIVRLCGDMVKNDVKPDRDCYETLIEFLCDFKYYDTAFEVCMYWSMNKSGFGIVDISMHRELIQMVESKSSISEDHFQVKSPKQALVDLYSEQIAKLYHENEFVEAKALFNVVVSIGVIPHQYVFHKIIRRYIESKDVDEVKRILHLIRQKGLGNDFYCNGEVIEFIANVGDAEIKEEAKKLLERKGFNVYVVRPEDIRSVKKITDSFLGISTDLLINKYIRKLKERCGKNGYVWNELKKSYKEMGVSPGCVDVGLCLLSFGVCYQLGSVVL